jgi:hypothetical protein
MSSNPWLQIPLEDYERHMSHHQVGQSTLLNALTKKYMDSIKPQSVIFVGIAGGNGLEHIDNKITQNVYGIRRHDWRIGYRMCLILFAGKQDHYECQ